MRQKLKTALAIVGLSAVVIVAVDVLGRVASAVDDRYFGPPTDHLLADDDLRASLPAYDGVDYDPRALLEEVQKSDRTVYEPYTIWKRRAVSREVHDHRHSRSASHGRQFVERGNALEIWMFGGSAVWGVGAPDHETIPSHLAALLNGELGIDSNVRNLGRRGFVSTQEVIYLMRELQAGRRPDVVVLYNGVNDAAAVSLRPEYPGVHVSFDAIQDRFESSGEDDDIGWFVRSTGLYKASRIVLDRFEGNAFERDGIIVYADQDSDSTPDYRRLAERGTDLWLFNARVIDGLARKYGFMQLVAFQPGLWSTGKPLDPSEESLIASETKYAGLKTIMAVRAEMTTILDEKLSDAQVPPGVISLNDLFADTPEPVYIDYVHVTGHGNEIAARRIATELLDRLCGRPGERLSERVLNQLSAGCP